MKQLTYILIMLFSIVTFSQEKKEIQKIKDIDKGANRVIDSLSKVYKVKIYSIKKERLNGVVTTSICYGKNGELVYKVIKTEKVKKED
ncbi:hypothetical protein [Flavobacterium sp.]|jgi:hypothetical protein|uniref:hypothetical protein n=1 Tax=Flavobacterium sp. TaxID=239 RepID=UPI0037BEA495